LNGWDNIVQMLTQTGGKASEC